MLHHVARALPGRLLFVRWSEGRELWDRVVEAALGLLALVLMPNHLHLLCEADVRRRLAAALAGYARWLNHRRGRPRPLWAPLEAPGALRDDGKIRRNVRYVHLNPCRARLVADPLAWPLSTHRDAVGLAPFPAVPPRKDPSGFHKAYVSSDPLVHVDGTELPTVSVAVPTTAQVLHATSAVTRTPMPDLLRRGPARSLFVRAGKTLSADTHGAIADAVGVRRWTVATAIAREDARVKMIARAAGDPRFAPLWDLDLRSQPGWFRYRDLE